ncbi:MAG: nucleotidyltransferase family protein [Intrasporangium sp.]|uniref:nucleotidyltransferase family protein n=1 Tax=Intrasporangium sp. TaxID=1925024 RepID=UPI003F7ED048
MKAFLLAAGLGTRLRPLTDAVPKCLVSVGGMPLLDLWLQQLSRAGVTEVLVNLHHLAEQVVDHLARTSQPVTVRTAYEPTLLGSAGTLLQNRDFVAGEESFLAVNADNLTDFDLRELVASHQASRPMATLGLFHAADPSSCGIVELRDGVVVSFEEKPHEPRGDLANAGLYVFDSEVLDLIGTALPQDIGRDLLPQLVGRARGRSLGDAYFADIGTPRALRDARHRWAHGRSVVPVGAPE